MNIKKPSITNVNQYLPITLQHSNQRSFIYQHKPAVLRPQSHQRPSSHTQSHRSFITSPSPLPHHFTQHNISNQYYAQFNDHKTQQNITFLRSPSKHTSFKHRNTQERDELKKSLMAQVQKHIIKLSSEIQNQSGLILNLQKKIQKQTSQIEQKNNIIRTLIYKMQFIGKKRDEPQSFQLKKIEDVENRVRLLMEQIEEQKEHALKKVQTLTQKIVQYFGTCLNTIKKSCFIFLAQKSIRIEGLNSKFDGISGWQLSKQKQIRKIIEQVKMHIKSSEDMHDKENCSQINSQKDTASHISSTHSQKNNEDMFLSDYFFHPKDQEHQNLKVMKELVKERKKLNQLPIRVYFDSFGRLKYFESRTFVFDRKGNFTTPSPAEMAIMQQKGWIKSVQE